MQHPIDDTPPPLDPIIAGPYREQRFAFVACLSHTAPADRFLWLALAKPGNTDPALAARILALLVLQRSHPLLHPVLVPTAPAPASAFFLPDGYWSDQRNLNVPHSVRAEVDRIGAVLRTEHAQYVGGFVQALSGRRPPSFHPIPAGFGLIDPDNECSLVPPPPTIAVDEAALGPWGTPEFGGQVAGIDYRKHRYLAAVSEDELTERATEAVINAIELEDSRKLIMNLADLDAVTAIARLGEVMEEIRLRHGDIPGDWYATLAARWGGPGGTPERTRKALDWIQGQRHPFVNGLAKFGKLVHMQQALDSGRLLISPASRYADHSLNRAQSATELSFTHELDARKIVQMEVLSEDRSKKIADLDPPLRAAITRTAATDAYVCCTALRISARLFHAFEADACLLIKDRTEFMRRLVAVTDPVLPEWQVLSFDVTYIDAFSPEARHARPLFDKPAGYRYQREHRIIWLPPRPQRALEPFFVELGCLADIAELITVDDPVTGT